MRENLQVAAYTNATICGQKYEKALSFNWKDGAKHTSSELFVFPERGEETASARTMFLRGNGHIRDIVKYSFEEDLDSIKPQFEAAFAFYSALPECHKQDDFIYKPGWGY